ncbi:MAG: phosphoenolpyruvate--protein phosphotransferase [Lachnospiraceae bacterium]|jgi:phosphotransferase system enzyme I (PtsI)|nr:phosphoenolpyruvate--protein phosphotransferase [Lachnospiraceae bacterium]
MIEAEGKSILKGIAAGRLRLYGRNRAEIPDTAAADPAAELARFEAARSGAIAEQDRLYRRALAESGQSVAAVFDIHRLMLEDEALTAEIRKRITDGHKSAAYAVRTACDAQERIFEAMDDPYLSARSADMRDIAQCVLDGLSGEDFDDLSGEKEPVILAADDITPSQALRLNKSRLLGFVTRRGSANSHTAILARSLNIPALVQCADIAEDWDGKNAILDGFSGKLYIDPTPETAEALRRRREEAGREKMLLKEMLGKSDTTADGTHAGVLANIGGPSDIAAVCDNDADGVGLFRTEYLFLNRTACPSEEIQYRAYREIVSALAPRPVTVRACDIGADKTAVYMQTEAEANPALGCRGIRYCLRHRELFRLQLRALLRASAAGGLSVMFPMVSDVRELKEAKKLLYECRQELAAEGAAVGEMPVGIMVETPAAVLTADELAAECDFFSIGTNDLIQYTCAVDRLNAGLEDLFETRHPAVLREIAMTVEAGHRHGIPVSICGEAAADDTLTETFLRMGVDSFSVNPEAVLPLRRTIRGIDLRGGSSPKA